MSRFHAIGVLILMLRHPSHRAKTAHRPKSLQPVFAKNALVPLASLLALAVGLHLWWPMLGGYLRVLLQRPGMTAMLITGCCGFLLLYRSWLRRARWWRALNVWEHEVVHALAVWSVGGQVHSIRATANGGELTWSGPRGHWWVALAPYWFPTLPLLWIAIWRWVLQGKVNLLVGLAVLGFVLAWHVVATRDELHLRQSDFQVTGLAYSGAFIVVLNALVLLALVSYACTVLRSS